MQVVRLDPFDLRGRAVDGRNQFLGPRAHRPAEFQGDERAKLFFIG